MYTWKTGVGGEREGGGEMNQDLHGYTGDGWIGVDLDGTLAFYDGWKGADNIGAPIPKMLGRVVCWIRTGRRVKILTARVSPSKEDHQVCRRHIEIWLEKNLYPLLPALGQSQSWCIPITHEKDHKMIELWDDRCVQVIPNTGERADGKE